MMPGADPSVAGTWNKNLHGTAAKANRETRLKIPMVPVNARVGRQALFDNITTKLKRALLLYTMMWSSAAGMEV